MGILTELVIASPQEAEEVARSTSGEAERPHLVADDLDQAKLSTLRAIVTNQEYEDTWIDEFRFLAGNQEDGPWVFSVPDAVVAGLAALPESRLKAAAKQWGRTEEFQIDRPPQEEIEAVLKTLFDFFREAKTRKSRVLMRVAQL